MLARIAEKIHEHDSLAGIELCHSGYTANNLWSREIPMAASPMPTASFFNRSRSRPASMDKEDIRNLRRAHRAAALRAKAAGFDLVYVYAGHGLGIFQQFLSRATNFRTDEYGGSLENRARLLREVIEDTKDAVGDSCAVPVRIAMNEFQGSAGLEPAEVEDAIAMMAELPDLWDLSLFELVQGFADLALRRGGLPGALHQGRQEAHQQAGRRRRPLHLARHHGARHPPGHHGHDRRRTALDCRSLSPEEDRGRPSRRHPRMHRLQHLRHQRLHHDAAPLHAEPIMGEEWRRGWHPETDPSEARRTQHILVVGAGPAGLEAARALGQRG